MKIYDAKVEETYRHLETGEFLKREKTGKLRVIRQKRWHRDVKVIMPAS